MYFMTFSTGQECVQRLFAAKDEKNAVKGSMSCGNPKVSDEHLTHYSKTAVLIFGIIAICISLFSKQIIPMLVFAFTMRSAGPFAAFIFGLTWKNVTKHAGIISIILGSIAGFWWQYLNEPFGIMAVIVGSVASVITFIIVFAIEKALGHPLIPLHISEK